MAIQKLLSPELYNTIFMEMGYGIIVSDKDGNFIMWNKTAQELFEKELELSADQRETYEFEVYGIDKKTKLHKDQYAMNRGLRGEHVKGEKMFIKNFQKPDGIYVKISSFPIFSEKEIEAVFVVVEDINQQQIFYDGIINRIVELETYLRKAD